MAVDGPAEKKTLILSLIYILYVVCVSGKYDLEIQPRYYSKETSGCASCGNRTCDSEANDIDCDNVFIFCTKPLGELVKINNMFLAECVNSGQILNEGISSEDIDFDELNTTYLLLFNGNSWSGVQLFVVVLDEDGREGPHDVVDVFRANITIALGSDYTNDTTYNGTFGFVELGLSFRVNCSIRYFGENCTDTDATITDIRSLLGYTVAGVVAAACVFGFVLAVVIILLTRKRQRYAVTKPETSAQDADITLNQNPVYGIVSDVNINMEMNQVYGLVRGRH